MLPAFPSSARAGVPFFDRLKQKLSTAIPKPKTKRRKSIRNTIYIREPGIYDFKNVLHIWKGKKWPHDKEYGPPALHILVSNVTIKNFAVSGAPDGVHVGSLPWSGANAVRKHSLVENVRFQNLQVTRIREDALTCQKNTRNVRIEDSHFWGGSDKVIQNDHCKGLSVERCGFYKGTRCIRWKAGTSGEVRDCRFLKCDFPIKADGNTWPEQGPVGRKRKGGPVRLHIENNLFYRSRIAIDAGRKVMVDERDNKFLDVRKKYRTTDGGKIL